MMDELEKFQAQFRTEQEKCRRLEQEVEAAKQSSVSRNELDRVLYKLGATNPSISCASQLTRAKKLKTLYEQSVVQLASVQSLARELQHSNDELSHSMEQTRAKAMQSQQQLNTLCAEHGDAQRQVESLTKKNLSLMSDVQECAMKLTINNR
ncbi:unnamed protein product [Peronospora belbahrii]|uniref:Uncharacterized protein n=1 Tax=Peronospora belbahrii TaxID=622444 RepID=A0AAU9L821_9STRA|nr:unnamed protein product [Peronospora belbahrii]